MQASTPASSFISRLNGAPPNRSVSYSGPHRSPPPSGAGEGDGDITMSASPEPLSGLDSLEVRRAKSLRAPGSRLTDSRRETAGLSSFAAMGSELTSPALSAFTPPSAARHALFSHHASPPRTASTSSARGTSGDGDDPMGIDTGVSSPPSPTSSGSAFSPASAFLSHFSSNASLRPGAPPPLAPDAQGARVLSYTLGKFLGRGGFSTVRLATHDNGEVFACKIVKRDDLSEHSGSLESFEEEIKIWQSLPRHPSLLPLIEMHRTPTHTFLISPYQDGGSLLDVLRREGGSERTARKWFPGVVKSVSAMHDGVPGWKGGLLHGDLKLDNFLVDKAGGVTAADFFMAKHISPSPSNGASTPDAVPSIPIPKKKHPAARMTLPAPTPHMDHHHLPIPPPNFPSASLPYAPPELLRAPPSPPSLAQDIWALGIILHALLTGKLPFIDAFDPRLQMKILRGEYEEPRHLGREWMECLRGCLDLNRETRWNIKRVRECDAVIGWSEVKPRSKSRSRDRRRRPTLDGQDYATDPLTSQPSPFSAGPRSARGISRDPHSRDPHSRDRGRPGSSHNDKSRPPRSRSASATRSGQRTTGNKVTGFDPNAGPSSKGGTPRGHIHPEDLVRSLEGIDITRGRSTATKNDTGRLAAPELPFGRRPASIDSPHRQPVAAVVTPKHVQGGHFSSNSPGRSVPRSRDRGGLATGAGDRDSSAGSNGGGAPWEWDSPQAGRRGRSGARGAGGGSNGTSTTSTSPSTEKSGVGSARPSVSRSRSRTPWEGEQKWDGGDLDTVQEDGTSAAGLSVGSGDRGRAGAERSRSRGRAPLR